MAENSNSSRVAAMQAALEDGTLLGLYKSLYLENKNQETLFALMTCLKESFAIVPMNAVGMSSKKAEELQNSEAAQNMDVDMEVRLEPELLQGEGMQTWMPVFSTIDEVPEDYLKEHEFVTGRVVDCIDVAHGFDGLTGIVIDPYTTAMELPFKLAALIDTVPSILELASQADEEAAEGEGE